MEQRKFNIESSKVGMVAAKLSAVGTKLSAAGQKMRTLTMAAGLLGGAAVMVGKQLDESMSKAKVVSGATGKDFEAQRKLYKKRYKTICYDRVIEEIAFYDLPYTNCDCQRRRYFIVCKIYFANLHF